MGDSNTQTLKECDLVMKGGLASGVVYPKIIVELAKHYRFRNLGGTSAGAIATVLAAAAEYRRQHYGSNAGFELIDTIDEDLRNINEFFSPHKKLKRLYGLITMITYLLTKWDAVKKKLAKQFPKLVKDKPVRPATMEDSLWRSVISFISNAGTTLLFSLLVICNYRLISLLIIGTTIVLAHNNVFELGVPFITLLGALVLSLALFLSIKHDIFKNLARNFFGMCTGLSETGQKEALTNWLSRNIDVIAFEEAGNTPLLIKDLADAKIEIATNTTDLSSRRPFTLPFRTHHFCFKKEEFDQLFPEYVVTYLVDKNEQYVLEKFNKFMKSAGKKTRNDEINQYLDVMATYREFLKAKGPKTFQDFVTQNGNYERVLNDWRKNIREPSHPPEYLHLATGDNMPVLLVARLSLSFPGLLSAIPLYRVDHSMKQSPAPFRRCIFTDGGVSSNFPIHFFDSLLPSRPTFGISLGALNKDSRSHDDRIAFPSITNSDGLPPVKDVVTIGGFLGSIFATAQNWRDNLQSQLPGNSDRIIEVRLNKNEGGLNLKMPRNITDNLLNLGEQAGKKIIEEFNDDEHRYERVMSTLPSLELSLSNFSKVYMQNQWARPEKEVISDGDAGLTWQQIITEIPKKKSALEGYAGTLENGEAIKKRYELARQWHKKTVLTFANELAELGADLTGNSIALFDHENVRSKGQRQKAPKSSLRIIASPNYITVPKTKPK